MATNWPISGDQVRQAIRFKTTDGADPDELAEYATAVCERIDSEVGRDTEPTRHEVSGAVPTIFVLAAKATARLWWMQDHNSPRTLPGEDSTVPMGADLPRRVQSWLAAYPPPPAFGQES